MTIENVSRGVHTCNDDLASDSPSPRELTSVSHGHTNSSKDDETDQSTPKQNMPFIPVSRSLFQDDSTYTSGTEVYKMVTRSEKGKRSPAHIEFNLYKKCNRPTKSGHSLLSFKKHKSSNNTSQTNSRVSKSRSRQSVQFKEIDEVKPLAKCKDKPKGNSTTSVVKSDDNGAVVTNQEDPVSNIDFYWFDRGDFEYLYTTDDPPHLASEIIARNTIECATKFWAEVYGSIHIGVAFIVALPMQTYRFCLYSIFRPVVIGLMQMTSDYAVKPLLAAAFNGFIQPPLRVAQNILSLVYDMLEPVGRMIGLVLNPVGELFRSFRLVEIHHHHYSGRNGGSDQHDISVGEVQHKDVQTECDDEIQVDAV